jgi:hypothetical protein
MSRVAVQVLGSPVPGLSRELPQGEHGLFGHPSREIDISAVMPYRGTISALRARHMSVTLKQERTNWAQLNCLL